MAPAMADLPPGQHKQSWSLPSGVGNVRNIWVTAAGDLLVRQSSSNRVGRVRVLPPSANDSRSNR